jgi:hypothetical protein
MMDIRTLFDSCLALSYAKRQDYTSGIDYHENFKRSEEIQSWFNKDEDKPYVVLIATKLARLASLLGVVDRVPINEPIEDSFKDLINYCALWAERRLTPIKTESIEPNPHRNTLCYFCHREVTDNAKVISGQYRQAHVNCWEYGKLHERGQFLTSVSLNTSADSTTK